jgi:integrase
MPSPSEASNGRAAPRPRHGAAGQCSGFPQIDAGNPLQAQSRGTLRGGFRDPAGQFKYIFARHRLDQQFAEGPYQNINAVRRISRRGPIDGAPCPRLRFLPRHRGYSAHSMRATFITMALENGAQLEDVQKAAGHRDPGTTKLYDRRGHNPEKAASFFATFQG